MPKKLTNQEFLERVKREQPNLIVLSEYNGADKRIKVMCKKHNHTFFTTPHRLRGGNNCQKCYDEKRGESTRKSIEEFIEKGNIVHCGKYDYSLAKTVTYKNSMTKIPIICPKHGVFESDYDHHINRKQGCPHCVNRYPTIESVIESFRKVHGDDYDYSNVVYKNNRTKVIIKCNTCGKSFEMTPDKHLRGQGCPFCKFSKMEKQIVKTLEKLNIDFKCQVNRTTFKWLKRLSLDFYIPSLNMAIECQGDQHFLSLPFYDRKRSFEERLKNDLEKKRNCEENGIKMIYFTTKTLLKESKKTEFSDLYTDENIFIIDDSENVLNEKISKIDKLLNG